MSSNCESCYSGRHGDCPRTGCTCTHPEHSREWTAPLPASPAAAERRALKERAFAGLYSGNQRYTPEELAAIHAELAAAGIAVTPDGTFTLPEADERRYVPLYGDPRLHPLTGVPLPVASPANRADREDANILRDAADILTGRIARTGRTPGDRIVLQASAVILRSEADAIDSEVQDQENPS